MSGSRSTPSPVAPQLVILLGAGGDLSWRKIHPAFNAFASKGMLPSDFGLIGVDPRFTATDAYPRFVEDGIGSTCVLKPYVTATCSGVLHGEGTPALCDVLGGLEPAQRALPRVYYLAVPHSVFPDAVRDIAQVERDLSPTGRRRSRAGNRPVIVVEKPFGRDLAGAKSLNRLLAKCGFPEGCVFRMDHYLAKEMVQSLLTLRFGNSIFGPVWDHRHIDHVQINVTETLGVESRGRSYDRTGALRDMVQGHMVQLLSLVAMEQPESLDPDDIRQQKVELIRRLRLDGGSNGPAAIRSSVVVGQYTRGEYDVSGYPVRVGSYQQELLEKSFGGDAETMAAFLEGAVTSNTETFVALKTMVSGLRWRGVPFFLRTGKRIGTRKCSEITVHFRDTGHTALLNAPPNVLCIRLEPDEGVSLEFNMADSAKGDSPRGATMDFDLRASFGSPVDPYQRLLHDVLLRDPTLFVRGDEVEAAWAFVDPIVKAFKGRISETYAAGGWGPASASHLIEKSTPGSLRHWRQPRHAGTASAGS